ncbi:MAG: sulfite exporter TauE/SafE family protein [Candidatus Omnitrophica bacterium]|nr:sulfite exporter TauE/SafE family protein [Candidatus Omnitrophota bacterium]
MIEVIITFGSALWLGILTSISPCPLATNIAAISFLSKRMNHPKFVLHSGLTYTFGRMVAYAVLGAVIITSLTSVSFIANFLQNYMNKVLGPILLIAGLFLLDVIEFNVPNLSLSQEKQHTLANSGLKGSFSLGVIFALSFCPISAALFFGSLIPLSLSSGHGIILPFIYGVGTGIPVVVFAMGFALGLQSFSHWFHNMTRLELYMRKVTGILFICVGIYFIWAHIILNML